MTRIAVSGHRGLSPTVEALIDRAIRTELSRDTYGPIIGLTCLADGADQIFAQAVLDLGGTLEAFIPATGYREALPQLTWPRYDELLSCATLVHRLDHKESNAQSHMDASIQMLAAAHLLLAVWDGQPARAFGGTADVVAHARENRIPVSIIWPEGAHRD